jgi:hypothetical protein
MSEERKGHDGKMKYFMKMDPSQKIGRFGPPDCSWVKGTLDEVRAWLKKETEGMISKSEEQEDNRPLVVERNRPEVLKDIEGTWLDPAQEFKEGHPHVSLTPELDAMKERVKDKSYFCTSTRKWIHPAATTGPLDQGEKIESFMMEVPDDFGKRKAVGKTEKAKGGNWKPTNPKDLMGIRKVSFCCLPFTVLGEVALGMQEGGMKYGRHNYRDEGVAVSTYIDAAIRHLGGFWEGEDIDPESGVHHISKAISTLVVVRDAMLNDKCTDDRPIKPLNADWLKELNVKASALVDKYPTPERPYTAKPLPERK